MTAYTYTHTHIAVPILTFDIALVVYIYIILVRLVLKYVKCLKLFGPPTVIPLWLNFATVNKRHFVALCLPVL